MVRTFPAGTVLMALLFNSLLTQFGIEASKVRLLRHKDSRAHKGCSPYEMWRDNRPAFELYQHSQSIENLSLIHI